MRDPHNPSHPVCHPVRRDAPVAILALAAVGPHGERPPGLYDAYLGTRLLAARTRQPFLDGARALVALGFDPGTTVVLKHIGSDTECLRARLGVAARLTVKERDRGRVTFEPWQDAPLSSPVAPPAAQMLPAYTEGHPKQFEGASVEMVS